MKAIVLAGGHATRLWPITKHRAKPLLPLGEKPIIDFMLEELDDEVEETIISTNAKFAGDFEDYIEEYDRNARVVVEQQDSEEEKPGTIGAIIKLIEKEGLDDDLLVVGGDNYFGFSFSDLLDFCREKDAPVNVVYDINDFEHAKQFGIVDTEEDRIVGFEEKPEEPPSTLASTACYYFPKRNVSLFNQYEDHFKQTDVPAEQYLDEPGRLIEWAHEREEMYAFSFSGEWHDVGTRKGYLEATEAVIDRAVISGDTENCEIGENVVVMEGARLENVEIENSIVFPEAEVKNSEIRSSLIDKKTEIEDSELQGAVIGAHTKF
ncbi:NDP-sugar synthase [Candidatus Nanohalococcus occultus]|uniref:N-acetylglucosamine-1-phosphate uridyltransferase n=1 Tax=Candidatus Nanohalococcus occultus TaxID=2978047 RepID=A0ABY8CDU7_9ARCH|nr:N-acetylglucosamine-1-phosphate uridyltransferase [Candidatus Nanohaloarchaeota archaeon SVXNc]